jgi:phage shock protein PspC (stress-responsive transcriptional regulator)
MMDERDQRSGWRTRLERPQEGRLLAGICVALARRLGVDVTLMRLMFLVLALASGLGLLLYLALWLLLPAGGAAEDRGWRGTFYSNVGGLRHELYRAADKLGAVWGRRGDSPWPLPLGRRWVALGLIAGGSLVLLYSLGLFAWLSTPRALGLAAIVAGAAVLLSLARS